MTTVSRTAFFVEWKEYARCTVPADAGVIQRVQTQRAFYAGALVILGLLGKVAQGGPDTTDDEVAVVQGLYDEIIAYTDVAIVKSGEYDPTV